MNMQFRQNKVLVYTSCCSDLSVTVSLAQICSLFQRHLTEAEDKKKTQQKTKVSKIGGPFA